MKTEQALFKNGKWSGEFLLKDADIVFVFAEGDAIADELWQKELSAIFGFAIIIGCSSSGSIFGDSVLDNCVVATAIKLEKSYAALAFEQNVSPSSSFEVGEKIATKLSKEGLKHIIVLSDGLNVNGSRLADGFNSVHSGINVHVSGGLAGDGARFSNTFVIANAAPAQNMVAAIGLYGDVFVKTGCFAGWDEFGTDRVITKSVGNVVYEIDGEKALELYKKYLGEEAQELPGSGLRFPLSIKKNQNDPYIIRTFLAVDEEAKSLIFAGEVPQGYICKLMKSNPEKLVENAGFAAKEADYEGEQKGVCLAVSCVGRRITLGGLVEEELEILKEILGEKTILFGFYSYGEIAPIHGLVNCFLHNQTMTVTTIYE